MEVVGGSQWRPKAVVTAVDACAACYVLALQYADCAVVRVRRSAAWRSCDRAAHEPQIDAGSDTDVDDLELHGHTDRIACVRVFFDEISCTHGAVVIASASSDCVMAWHVDVDGRTTQAILVDHPTTEPTSLAFDATGTMLAIATESTVNVLTVARGEQYATLEGHIARVTKCEFHPVYHHLIITTSEDRTFKIWDLSAKVLRFQSAVLSAFSILSLAMNPATGDAAFGFADGTVKIFTIQKEGSFARQLAVVDVAKHLRKAADQTSNANQESHERDHLPAWASTSKSDEPTVITNKFGTMRISNDMSPADVSDIRPEIACPVIALQYLCADARAGDIRHDSRRQFNAHGEQDLLDQVQFMVVGVPNYLLAINAYSFEVSILHDFQVQLHEVSGNRALDAICVAKDFCFQSDWNASLQCGILSAFQPCFTVLQVRIVPANDRSNQPVVSSLPTQSGRPSAAPSTEGSSANANVGRTSVIPSGPPPKDSVLNLAPLEILPKLSPSKKSLDKPITFRTRIKSSGYGASTPRTLFGVKKRGSAAPSGKKINNAVARSRSRPSSSSSADNDSVSSAPMDPYLKEYPTSCGLLKNFQEKNLLPPRTLHQGAIMSLEYSHDAKWLATCGNDKVAQVCRLPFSKSNGEGSVFSGHDQAVRSIHWSANNRMVATTSSDKTTRLWLIYSDTPALTFQGAEPISSLAATATTMTPTLMSRSGANVNAAKKPVRKEIADAMFFYMDRFIVSACGNVVRLHQFELDEEFARVASTKSGTQGKRRNDIDVLENRSRKKKAAQWVYDDMQNVTSLSCVNGSILSPVVVVAGSDRSLRILDTGVGKTTRVIADAHAGRAIHTLALPRASCYTSHPSNFYDLLASSAANSTVHLWDVRADNCVMRFGEHVNRVHTLGVAFSPCMRYIATGSEDRAAYLYDLRTGRCVTKLGGHTDVVTSVAFNPLHPQLATASYDSTVRFYTSV